MTEEECETAVGAVGMKWYVADAWAHNPRACFYNMSGDVFYNRHGTGDRCSDHVFSAKEVSKSYCEQLFTISNLVTLENTKCTKCTK